MGASFSSSTYTPDRLVAGDPARLLSRSITLLSGQNLARGAVLGKQSTATVPTTGTAGGSNTGNGTMGSVAAGGTDLIAGTYTARCIEAATNAGDFEVIDPDGDVIGIATVGVAFTSSHLNFTIADGSTDFAVGDSFTVAVATVDKYKLSAAAAVDGSQVPDLILAEATDASSGDVVTVAYERGDFDENEIVLGSGHTAASIREGLRKKGINLVPSITA